MSKARCVAGLILDNDLSSYVEIGVYRGRSLLAVASALEYLGRGLAVGIDPWQAVDAAQVDLHLFPVAASTVNEFTASLDWDAIHGDVITAIQELGVGKFCRLIRARSTDVVDSFGDGSIEVLHVDGNHDRDAVLLDVAAYLPKLAAGGYIVLDDASWQSVSYARRLLLRMGATLVVADPLEDFEVYLIA